MDTASPVGYYGKLPCNGDFLQRSVPQEFVDAWDAWLQECLHASRQDLGEQWREAYLTSALWRFALAEGVCGSGAYAGVMVPSVDRVGRYFPLTVVTQLSSEDCLLDIACDGARPWFESVEALVLQALEAADLELGAFDAQLAGLTGQLRHDGAEEANYLRGVMRQGQFALQSVSWHVPLVSVSSLQRAANVFASQELERSLRPLALWWTEGSRAVAPAWLCTRGLPSPASYTAFLTAGWDARGWASLDPGRDARFTGALSEEVSGFPDQSSAFVEAAAVTVAPRVEVTAWHEPVTRQWDAQGSEPLFVERPELGLWGVACQELIDPSGDAAQKVADILQNVSQAATLSALVEAVRQALEQVQRQSATADPAAALTPTAQTVVFMARGDECALVCIGNVQAIRFRSSQVSPIVRAAEQTDGAEAPPAAVSAGSSLMDLLAAPAAPGASIRVRYEALWPGDAWVLAGGPLLDEPRLAELAEPLAIDESPGEAPFAAVRSICRSAVVPGSGALPVLLLTTRSGQAS